MSRVLRRALMWLAALLTLGAIGGAAWLVGWSDATALDEVRVSGATGELAEAVTATAQAPLGTPLIRVDTGAVEEAVRGLPDVAEVSVTRSWPRALVVSVTPRMPVAAVEDGSSWWLVDRAGVLFGASPDQPSGLPVLDAPTDPEAVAARAAGVAVLTGLPEELRELVTGVSAPTEASVQLTLEDGATVLWGTAERSDRKAEVLLALLDREASGYDVSAPSNPAVRP